MLLSADLPALEAEIERHILRLRNRRASAARRTGGAPTSQL